MTTQMLQEDLPYEKFIRLGAEALTDAELLAILLRTGSRSHTALELAKDVLRMAGGQKGGLNDLHHLSLQQLMTLPGIGEVKAVRLKCAAEMSIRMASMRARDALRFDRPSTIADYYMEKLRHQEKENVLLLLLDNKLQLIEEYKISLGTVNASLLSVRDVFIEALRCRASRIMLLHNHPSGDPSPSAQDIAISGKIKEAGELMDITLIDHIILGDGRYVSLKEKGLL